MTKNINWGKDIHPNSSYNSTKHIAEIGLNSGKNLYICLICNKSLDGDESIFSSNHVLCSSHKEHLKTLFYKCIPSNVDVNRDEKFAKLITNSMFDISICLSDQTSSLLHRYENHIVCMFCQDIVCYCQDDTVKDDIINHLQSDSHINNVKNNATWVYQLETSSGFLMLHKTVTFCSICDKLLYAQENDTLHSAVDHLLTEHQTELNKSESDPCSIIDDSDEFESLRQNDAESGSSVPIYDSWEEILLNEETSQESYSRHKKSKNVTKKEHSFQNELEDQDTRMAFAKTNNSNPLIITVDCFKTIEFCVVCKKVIQNNLVSKSNNMSTHVRSKEHKENIELLLFHCMPEPFSNKTVRCYNELVSAVNNETGCVMKCENLLVCLICKQQITNLTQSFETIKYDLFYHFGSKHHMKSMRDNVWWYYYLHFGEAFNAFDNHVSDCSECASNLEKIPHRVIQCAREHLVTLDNDEFKLVCPECKETVEMYNDDPEFSMDLHYEKHKDISEINNLFNTNVAFYNNSEYPCPSCQENVHIFNKNIQLSFSLHVCNGDKHLSNRCENFINYNASTVFDHLPDFLRVHCGFFQLDRTNFCCTLCNCTFDLPSSLDKAREDVLMHLTDQYHNKQFQSLSQDPWNLLSKDNKLDNVLLLESVIEENKQYVEKCERYYFCKACKCCFLTFGNDQEMMQLFAMHCLCKNHKKKFKRYIEERNWEDKKYEQENNDTGNNESSEHTSPATQKNNDKDFFKRFYNLSAYQLNSLFLVLEGNSVRCKLCKISISCSQINQVRKHCYSESHSMILVKSASNYIARHENKQLVNTSDPRNSKFINAVKKLAISNYRINDHTVTPHLLFIDNDGNNFVCLICNTRVAFSVDCSYLLKHFTTKGHKLKIFNLSLDVAEIGSKLNKLDSHASSNKFCVEENDFYGKPNETDNIDEVSRLFEKLPSEHKIYKDFIKKDGRNLTCLLCGCSLLSRQTFEGDLKCLQDHFSNSLHSEQYKLYTAGPISKDESVNQDLWEKFNDCSNVELLAERKWILDSNSQHLKKENFYFKCCLCDEYFLFFDEGDLKNTFASHCLTIAHLKKLKKKTNKSTNNNCVRLSESKMMQLNAQSIANHPEDCHISKDLKPISGSMVKKSFAMSLNRYYLFKQGDSYYCGICQVTLKVNEQQLKNHCYSVVHNVTLTKNAIAFFEGLKEKSAWQITNLSQVKILNVMKMLAKRSYKNSNSGLGHLFFLKYKKNQVFCCLCNKKFTRSTNEYTITNHFTKKEHSMNVLKLCCIYSSPLQCETLSNEKVRNIVPAYDSNCAISSKDYDSQTLNNEDISSQTIDSHPCQNPEIKTLGFEAEIEGQCGLQSTLEFVNSILKAHRTSVLNTSSDSLLNEDVMLSQRSGHEDIEEKSCEQCLSEADLDFDTSEDEVPHMKIDKAFEVKTDLTTMNAINADASSERDNDDEDYYYCPHCNSIKTSRPIVDGTKGSCEKQVFDVAHYVYPCEKHFMKNIYDCLPSYLQRRKEVISLQSSTLYCSMCQMFIEINRKNVFESAVQLYFHLSLRFHHDCVKSNSREINLKPPQKLAEKNATMYSEPLSSPCQALTKKQNNHISEFKSGEDEYFEDNIQVSSNDMSPTTNSMPSFTCCDTWVTGEKPTSHSFTQNDNPTDQEQATADKSNAYMDMNFDEDLSEGAIAPKDFLVLSDTIMKGSKVKILSGNLEVHEEFLSNKENSVTCELCSVTLLPENVHDHLTSYTHKQMFLARLKRVLGGNLSIEIKCLMFISNQLFCKSCSCYIYPWDTFDTICQGVASHLKTHESYCERFPVPNPSDQLTVDSQKNNHTLNDVVPSQTITNHLSTSKNSSNNGAEQTSIATEQWQLSSVSDNIFERLASVVNNLEENKEFIILRGSNYHCNLCNKGITFSPNDQTLAKNFKSHIFSNPHRLNFNAAKKKKAVNTANSSQQMTSSLQKDLHELNAEKHILSLECEQHSVNEETKISSPSSSSSQRSSIIEELVQRLKGPIVLKIHENQEFFSVCGTNYHCNLCNKGISYSPNDQIQAYNFNYHIKSSTHKFNLNVFKKQRRC